MRKLLDSSDDYLKTEHNVREYIHSLSDSQLKYYYEAIEFTSFSIVLAHEYAKRFGKKIKKTKSFNVNK